MKTVRYCFVTFYLNSRLFPTSFSVRPFQCRRYDAKPFFVCLFYCFKQGEGGNMAMCKRTLTLLSNTCVTFLASLNSFRLISSHFGRYCERSTGTKGGDGKGGEYKIYSCWVDWSCDETCHSHIKENNNLKSHSEPVKENERPTSCLQRRLPTWNENSRRHTLNNLRSQDISFNIVAHCGLTERAFSGHYHDRFQLGLSLQLFPFFYTLTVFICFRAATCTP